MKAGEKYFSSTGNVWAVDRVEGDRMRVVLICNGTGDPAAFQGAGFWWSTDAGDLMPYTEVAYAALLRKNGTRKGGKITKSDYRILLCLNAVRDYGK